MDSSTSRLLRGFLEPCLLALLESGADYGLSLTRRLTEAGLEKVPGGSLYPALTRLERRGLVTTFVRPSDSGPARKYYQLTDAGHAELATRREEWRAFRTAFSAVLEAAPPTSTHTRAAAEVHQ
ncbi:MAG: PadR family transcriptional regulator [Actinomyces ruminicola]|uniref:PadR family transcriptional regulator, regulatory protein PadR n=1 Tax=Actinomyces ruminicola TaxID=332524 RepID=A0A1G9S893_9ACTO|nr:PadR family transcriptional regulator [Actinomyces ruminicola]MBE6482725.1 PadR family transcriptional regulator [Actinomyces ruminicola]SDM31689.1 PadR family transcriptional regulator, regulatory protein PadR [Actinomyces ruminicola]